MYSTHAFGIEPGQRQLTYQLSSPKQTSHKTVVLLNDNPDTLPLAQSFFSRYFLEEGFHVILPAKAGADKMEKRNLDNREARLHDLESLLHSIDSLYNKEVIVMGFGEGGYLAPALGAILQASKVIVVNASAHSPLFEMETMVRNDTFPALLVKRWPALGIADTAVFAERLQNIKDKRFGLAQLPPSTNNYWMSYYDAPLTDVLARYRGKALWVNFDRYPLLAPSAPPFSKRMAAVFQNITYLTLPGTGNLRNEDESTALLREVKNFISPD